MSEKKVDGKQESKQVSTEELIQQMKNRLKCELELTNLQRSPDTCNFIKTLVEGIMELNN